MRRLAPPPSRRPPSPAGDRRRPGEPAPRRRAVAVGLALVGVLGAPSPVGAQTASPGQPAGEAAAVEAEIARLRAEADALSTRYLEAVERLAMLQQRIAEIEARIPTLADEVARLRAQTRARAVSAYKQVGRELSSVIDASNALQAARRIRWLDRLNARDDALASALRSTSSRLANERDTLHDAREIAAAALDEVRDQGTVIDALLTEAQQRRQRPAVAAPAGSDAAPSGPAGTTSGPAPSGSTGGSATSTTRPATSAPGTPGASPPVPPSAPAYTPTSGTHPRHLEPFLVCTRARESGGSYVAYNPAGPYMGAYQFLQSTWNATANHAGRPELIGVAPHAASPYDQDDLAWALYQWRGSGPWGGRCDPE